jgi:chloride channel protein, CIC family
MDSLRKSARATEEQGAIWSDGWRFRLLTLVLGILTGIVGTAFRLGVNYGFARYARLVALGDHRSAYGWLLAAISGAVMVSSAAFVTRRFAPEAAGSGVQEIEGVLGGLRPAVRWARVLPVKFFGGLLAMSAGLILGREGPSIHIGGAVGAAIAKWRPLPSDREKILVGAGSAAGLGVAFDAPIGGILFAMEEIRREFPLTPTFAQCVTLTTVTAIIVGHLIAGPGRILPIPVYSLPRPVDLGLMLPFAMIIGAFGVILNFALLRTLEAFRLLTLRTGWLLPAAIIGGLVGLLVRSFPDVTGGGEELVMHLLQSPQSLAALIILLVVRTVLFNLSYGVGTPGGIFFPIVAFGAVSGLSFARTVERLFPALKLDPGKCAVAGMAALLGATVRAPLTGLMLIIEMTGSYQLVVMSLLASIIADASAEFLGGRPIYEQLLDRSQGSSVQSSHLPLVDS